METLKTIRKGFFRLKFIHQLIIATVPTVGLLLLYFLNRDNSPKITPVPNFSAFINVDNNEKVKFIYNLQLQNSSAVVSGFVMATDALLTAHRPFNSTFQDNLNCKSTIKQSIISDFNSIEIYPKSSVSTPIILEQDTTLNYLGLNGNSCEPLTVGEYILMITIKILHQSKPILIKYSFSLSAADIKKIYRRFKNKQAGKIHPNFPIRLKYLEN